MPSAKERSFSLGILQTEDYVAIQAVVLVIKDHSGRHKAKLWSVTKARCDLGIQGSAVRVS